MSLTPYGGQLPSRWDPNELGRYLSYQAYRMYYWLRHIAPILVKTQLRQMERNVIDNLPFVSTEAKRDIKRWVGDYDPSYYAGNFLSTWADHNVNENGQWGMRIHAKFTVRNLKNTSCRASVYFYLKSGAKLKDFNNSYCATDGQVAVSSDFTPGYDDTTYNDFILFMPYSELHLAKGVHELNFDIELYDQRTNTHFVKSNSYSFQATQG